MNRIILQNFLVLATLIFVGCGSSDKKDSNSDDTVVDSLLAKAGSVKSNNVAQRFSNNSQRNSTSKVQRKSEKDGVYACDVSGTEERQTTEEGDLIKYFEACIDVDLDDGRKYFQDGIMAIGSDSDTEVYYFREYTYIADIEKSNDTGYYNNELVVGFATSAQAKVYYLNGDESYVENGQIKENFLYRDFIYGENSETTDFRVSGEYEYKSKCFSEKYSYETLKNLIPSTDKPDYYESGTIIVNGIKYVYDNNKVTLSKDGKSETFIQQELLDHQKEVTGDTSCSSTNDLSKPISSKKSSSSVMLNELYTQELIKKLMQ